MTFSKVNAGSLTKGDMIFLAGERFRVKRHPSRHGRLVSLVLEDQHGKERYPGQMSLNYPVKRVVGGRAAGVL